MRESLATITAITSSGEPELESVYTESLHSHDLALRSFSAGLGSHSQILTRLRFLGPFHSCALLSPLRCLFFPSSFPLLSLSSFCRAFARGQVAESSSENKSANMAAPLAEQSYHRPNSLQSTYLAESIYRGAAAPSAIAAKKKGEVRATGFVQVPRGIDI